MSGFKEVWFLGCGVRVEHYLHNNKSYLIIPMYGYVEVQSWVVASLGTPDFTG